MMQRQIELPDGFDTRSLFGSFDSNIKLVEKSLEVKYAPHYDETPSEKTERGVWEIEGRVVYDCRRK